MIFRYLTLFIFSTLSIATFANAATFQCVEVAEQQFKEWHAKNLWRKQPTRLAEFCEHSPTQDIGSWVSRCWDPKSHTLTLKHIQPQGVEKIVLQAEDCKPYSFLATREKSLSADFFTDARLAEKIKNSDRGIIYLWSPRAPFSIEGLQKIKEAAARAEIPVTYVLDPTFTKDSAQGDVPDSWKATDIFSPVSSVELLERGAGLHYPTLYFFKDGEMVETEFLGFKAENLYDSIIKAAFLVSSDSSDSTSKSSSDFYSKVVMNLKNSNALQVSETDVEIIIDAEIHPPLFSAYAFDPVPAESFVDWIFVTHPGFGSPKRSNYMFNVKTQKTINVLGNLDGVATTDGRFLVQTWGFKAGTGISFQKISSLLEGKTEPYFIDENFFNDYHSIGTLSEDGDTITYRLLAVSRSDGTEYRLQDYRYNKTTDELVRIGDQVLPCDVTYIYEVPRLSKDGRYLSFVAPQGKAFILELGPNGIGDCNNTAVLDDHIHGKANFAYNKPEVAYVSLVRGENPNSDPAKDYKTVVNVSNFLTGKKWVLNIDPTEKYFFHFPQFLKDGRIIVQRTSVPAYDGYIGIDDVFTVVSAKRD